MSDEPATLNQVWTEYNRRANAARLEVKEIKEEAHAHTAQSVAYYSGIADGWRAAAQAAAERHNATGYEDPEALQLLALELGQTRLRAQSGIGKRVLPSAVPGTSGWVEALMTAEVMAWKAKALFEGDGTVKVQRSDTDCARCSAGWICPDHTPDLPPPAVPRGDRGPWAEQRGEENLADWSEYPKVPFLLDDTAEMAELHDLCLFMGGDSTSFTGDLLRLIGKADPDNLKRLEAGYPRHVRAYVLWRACAPVRADTLVKVLEASSALIVRRS